VAPLETRSQETAVWRKASFCQAGECAEVAAEDEEILLRSTRSPETVVRLTTAEWQALTKGIQAGEFASLA
jgi:hypothetical protein